MTYANNTPIRTIIEQQLTADDHALASARSAIVRDQIKQLGADAYDLLLPETHALPYALHPHENVLGIVYGRYKQDDGRLIGRGVMVATEGRVFLLDKKPLYIRSDEVIYGAVSGVTYTLIGIIGTVTLHSKIGDIKIRTLNQKCARSFVEAVESQIFNDKGELL